MSRKACGPRTAALLAVLVVVGTERAIPASDPKPEATTAACAAIRVEVSVEPLDSVSDAWSGVVEGGFEISADVVNDCPGEISILAGEMVTYQSELPPMVGETPQPRECLKGHLSVEGVVRPGQALRRSLVVDRCTWPAESEKSRSVRTDGGLLRTSAGTVRYAPMDVVIQ